MRSDETLVQATGRGGHVYRLIRDAGRYYVSRDGTPIVATPWEDEAREAFGLLAGRRRGRGRGPRWGMGDRSPVPLPGREGAFGEGAPSAKLDAGRVRRMRQLYAGGWTLAQLGAAFGVSAAAAHLVVTRRTWRHVD